ncbi:MAG: hypothetical protein K9J16_09615 [Melioribacteraceae bacterium]|nr:hypothetical protein [Melioribacteraceae bacterium]MCF8354895.1 hypothetical protein [Melioribacteraceae bacterium]MCF8393883.1 hypothetical protein [Melioribacteraceae bacterium]MCF8419655.1 hypothetical protein [Melioribacteraceae bacterium]
MNKNWVIIIFFMCFTSIIGQDLIQREEFRSDSLGAFKNRREGVMDGNQVRTLFQNNGEVGQWPFQPSGEWPKGTGHSYLDGVAALISAEILAPGNNQIVHPLETSYREWMDEDPRDGTIWGMEPLPNYSNPGVASPAINTKPGTWPAEWPDVLPDIDPADTTWDGLWYGYFGKGVQNSDFETFFVMDDSKDKEWTRIPYSYYPIESMHERGGLGLRIEIRGFQWSHVLAEDIIFWHYDIVNLADATYTKTLFGFYTDTGVGGTDDSGDDSASFDTILDLTYAYDEDGVGVPGAWQTGYFGYAYLESPGNALNGIDDDEDGLVDESRDNGIDDDGDWIPFSDLNGNGEWDADENEPLNSDTGTDGIGPFDRQYTGPDLDGTEGNGVPDFGEPNFDKTDIDESDMIGLTSLSIYRLGDGGTGGGWPKDDESMWTRMNYANFDTSLQRANISMTFASGPFELEAGRRERFSMALVFGDNFEDLVFNKETVQQIYNANYNFSKPPLKPTVTAVPGDKKVFLYWDDIAEESRDPFLGYENDDPTQGYKKDFEGYMIYRSKEPEFNDIKIVTDSKGNAKYWRPIAQFDLVNGIEGPDPVGIQGASFWRGSETGLQHSYVDEDVVNGETYYYAVVSYDQGDPNKGTAGLTPSECTKNITVDFAGNLQFVDINCAVVMPNVPAAGYQPPEILGNIKDVAEGSGTGDIKLLVLNTAEILEDASYKVEFESTGDVPTYETSSANVVRTYKGAIDTIITSIPSSEFGANNFSTPFDGMTLSIVNDTLGATVDSLTGWLIGESNVVMTVFPNNTNPTNRNVKWPADYEIQFYDDIVDTSFGNNIEVKFKVYNKSEGRYTDFYVDDKLSDGTFSYGDDIVVMEYLNGVASNWRFTWRITYNAPSEPGRLPIPPEPGDVYQIKTSKPFFTSDYFQFSTKAASVDAAKAKDAFAEVSVVPNPYISTARWESRNLNQTGRGERRIDFINLPAECTVRIYTISGALVKTLYKEYGPTNGTVSWNLVTEDGMDVAYGLYIYHIDAPGIGEHIGKFAIIK